jgi:hypothetical protein
VDVNLGSVVSENCSPGAPAQHRARPFHRAYLIDCC